MARDPHVAVRSRSGRPLDVTDRAVERAVVGARQHRHFELNLRDPKHGERRRGRVSGRFPPQCDSFRRPQRLIRRGGFPVDARSAAKRARSCLDDIATPTWNVTHHTTPTRPKAQHARSANRRNRSRVVSMTVLPRGTPFSGGRHISGVWGEPRQPETSSGVPRSSDGNDRGFIRFLRGAAGLLRSEPRPDGPT